MRVIKITLNNVEIDTVFWYGPRDTLDDIKKCLVEDDSYDAGIVIEEVEDEFA